MPWFPRKRVILAFHRWLGAFSALFLLILALTGLVLNHTERLGLNGITIRSAFILERYGMSGGEAIQTYRIDETNTVSHLGDRLFFGVDPLVEAGLPVGFFEGEGFRIIVTPDELVTVTPSGELIEKLDTSRLPFETVLYLGKAQAGDPVVVARDGLWKPDADWLEFTPYEGPFEVTPPVGGALDKEDTFTILQQYQGGGVSLYRVLLDLHSGRLFGWGGRTVMDLAALAIIFLLSSGVVGWVRKSRKNVPRR